MKVQAIKSVIETTVQRLPPDTVKKLKEEVRQRRPPDLVPTDRIRLREIRLAEADIRPSPVALERILGTNDLVDVNYLTKASLAARSVCRVVLRDTAGREIGYGTGFLVSPRLLLTNHHVLETAAIAEAAHAEFDYELDPAGYPRPTTRFALDPCGFYLSDTELDFALVAVRTTPVYGSGRLVDYRFLPLLHVVGKINIGEFMSLIQHPSGQPKQIALRENQLLAIEDLVLWYESDTAHGSSGAPAFNDSWQVVALHHSGVPRTDDQGRWLLKSGQPAGPDADDGEIDWIANEGIRASRIVKFVEANGERGPLLDEFQRGAAGQLKPISAPDGGRNVRPDPEIIPLPVPLPPTAGTRVTVPVTFTITVEGSTAVPGKVDEPALTVAAAERMKVPVVDPDYATRRGYDPEFLGLSVPLPEIEVLHQLARLDDDSHVLPYEHFSVVMNKSRRLSLLTASNVDANSDRKKPEPGRDYTRRGLGGLGENDIEQWLIDPRIPEAHQLPDRFYTRDGGAFDKGHLVRRDDVCWGDSYAEVRRANGDTYHTTNCSPQVADFNRSSRGGIWGKLENEILRQARTERYCVLAGPWLRDSDRVFVGRDHRGEVLIQIPSAYWKIVVARTGDQLQAFTFLLEQDLAGVPLEFAMRAEWVSYLVPIAQLEAGLGYLQFPAVLHEADQAATPAADELFLAEPLRGLERR